MIDQRCLGPDVDRSKISPDADIRGASYLTGSRTTVAAGAVVIDSRLHDVVVERGASVVDSICTARGEPHSHRCDTAGRVVVSGCVPATIDAGAQLVGSTLTNTSVGARSLVEETSATDCAIGADNTIRRAKIILTETLARVTVVGPTEISEARLGHGATIDRRGYFEGVFSNTFLRLRFVEDQRRLKVVGTIDLPHVSRYGTNTINSTNSGKLLPQPDGILRGLGRHGGLWHDPLLSHEQIELGPCCWVAPWTKVVGQSPDAHHDDEALVNDRLTTYLMPFSIAGVGGELTRGLVMPGELSLGLGPKQRRGAWTFTYAPGAVIAMVARLHAALPEAQKHVADTIVVEALSTAVEMTRAMAAEYEVDLGLPVEQQRRGGWPRWIATTHALLRAHLDHDLWRFDAGRPCDWREQNCRWHHPRFEAVLAIAPDALERQWSEEEVFKTPCKQTDADGPRPVTIDLSIEPLDVAVPAAALDGSLPSDEPSRIDAKARVDATATIGPGCRIGPGAVVGSGVTVWRSAVDDCHVEAGATVERCDISGGRVGAESTVRSCRLVDSTLGARSTAECASIERSELADRATVTAFASVRDAVTRHGAILGGRCHGADIRTTFMSMHLAGDMAHVEALPTRVVLNGRPVDVPAVPMIGGGAILRGSADAPVRVECSFVGSNAVVEAGARIGFGCFVLGRLPSGTELLPLTISTDEDLAHHQIGGVLGSLSSTIITHFLGWAYQAAGPDLAPAVAQLVPQSIQRGIHAIETEQVRRADSDDSPRSTSAASTLAAYTDKQLAAGLANYRRALGSGAWEMVCRGGELYFAGRGGNWHERAGTALWRPRAHDETPSPDS